MHTPWRCPANICYVRNSNRIPISNTGCGCIISHSSLVILKPLTMPQWLVELLPLGFPIRFGPHVDLVLTTDKLKWTLWGGLGFVLPRLVLPRHDTLLEMGKHFLGGNIYIFLYTADEWILKHKRAGFSHAGIQPLILLLTMWFNVPC